MHKGNILVVDDDAFFRTLCLDVLTNNGFFVQTAASGAEAINRVENETVDIVITDLVMPDMNGLDVIRNAKQINALIDVIVITGHGTIETAIEALKNGAYDYVRKPFTEEELVHTVTACMEKRKLLEENTEMRMSLKLFEVSKVITATIDINKLYNISLDALLQIVPADAGIVVFFDAEAKKLEITAARHIGTDAAEEIVEVFRKSYENELRAVRNITVVPSADLKRSAGTAAMAYNSFLLAPLILPEGTNGQTPTGFLFLLSKRNKNEYGVREINNAGFIAEHAAQAFHNARQYAEAKGLAFLDSLTNLYNSKYLDAALDKELKRADRLLMPLTVLFVDLDNFKQVNDRNDHLAGSKVLVDVSRVILKAVREVDTVIRYGGDEFVVVLVDADYDVSLRVAERIRSSIEDKTFLEEDGLNVRITASIGVATYPIHTRDKKELLQMADKAMYRAKDISRNAIYVAPVPGGN
ncbi:MAG: diguanylate cyclase [Deltaproteobacteria bacterium]|nr:diguanylate cyclase [Deltaproteobacteria bacterium]